jgi:DNA-binding NtrC family response regulator
MAAETAPTRPRRVLVVEDLPDVRQSLQDLFQLGVPDVEVETAEDGLRALEMLAERPYAVVVTDLSMPRASGMRLLREVKDRGLSCAVVIVTGHGGVREAVEAMRLGATDFLTKPVDPEQLVLLIDRLLRGPDAPAGRRDDGADETVSLYDPTAAEDRATGS